MRCSYEGCKKKITLVEQQTNMCRCGMVFCGKHRSDHNCSFNYREEQRKELQKKMTKITPQKVPDIY